MSVQEQGIPGHRIPGQRIPDQRIIQGAFAVSLLLHALVAVLTWRLPLFPRPSPQQESALAANEIEVELLPAQPQDAAAEAAQAAVQDAADPEQRDKPPLPTAYTEIPDRQASAVPPEQAEYLALHHSLAADNVLGGDSQSPKADQEWISDQVQIQQEDLQGVQGVLYTPQMPVPVQPAGQDDGRSDLPADDQAVGRAEDRADDSANDSANTPAAAAGNPQRPHRLPEPAGPDGQWARNEPTPGATAPQTAGGRPAPAGAAEGAGKELAQWWQEQPPSILQQGQDGASGDRGFDFNQAAKGKVASGVAIDGDFSLNTYEWNYAPWMHRFTNELYRHWIPPYAYRLGILDGHTVIKLVVAKDGRVEVMDVIETEGHESLHEASVAALQAFAPYAPLPPDFPEENLVITLGLYYPAPRR